MNHRRMSLRRGSLGVAMSILVVPLLALAVTTSGANAQQREVSRTTDMANRSSAVRSSPSQGRERGGWDHRREDRRRSHHSSPGRHYDRSHYRGYYRPYPRTHFYWYGGYYPFYVGWDWPIYRHPYPSWGYGSASGALDLDVVPEEAEVFVDGRPVGAADNFDGLPTYLWLEPGTYEIAFFHQGFETLSREYRVANGVVTRVRDRLLPGEAVRPEPAPAAVGDLEERVASAEEKKLDIWRERADQSRSLKRTEAGEEPALDVRAEPGRLLLTIRPRDASVYLDGRFLGTGAELSRLHAGLIVDPGEHELQIVRPGYTEEKESFEIETGEDLELEIELDEAGS